MKPSHAWYDCWDILFLLENGRVHQCSHLLKKIGLAAGPGLASLRKLEQGGWVHTWNRQPEKKHRNIALLWVRITDRGREMAQEAKEARALYKPRKTRASSSAQYAWSTYVSRKRKALEASNPSLSSANESIGTGSTPTE